MSNTENTGAQAPDLSHPMSKLLPKRPEGPMRSPARVLGWFSIGLGLAELLAPKVVGRAVGIGDATTVLRLHGLREIGCGAGLLLSRDPTPWLWGRVVGDAVDIATVGAGAFGGKPVRSLVALAALGAVLAADTQTARAAQKGPRKATRDYSARSGFPKPAQEMRGAALRPLVAERETATV